MSKNSAARRAAGAAALAMFALCSTAAARQHGDRLPGAKTMFYDPGDLGLLPPQPAAVLRPVRYAESFIHCGIHYWLQRADGTRMTQRTARAVGGKFTVHLRNNVAHGFLSVWDVSGGRELTPLDPDVRINGNGRWHGLRVYDEVYTVPGTFEFVTGDSAPHLVIAWMRSQTEIPDSAADARRRVKDIRTWWPIIEETDESNAGEIGTYVVNRTNGGVVTEVSFRK